MRGIQGFTADEIDVLADKVIAQAAELKGFADGLRRNGFPKNQQLFVDGGNQVGESDLWISDLLNKLRFQQDKYVKDPPNYETQRLKRKKGSLGAKRAPAKKAKK